VPDVHPAAAIPEWSAPPLPVTASDGNVTMQINNVTSSVYTWSSGQGIEENVQINLATEFLEDGQPAPHWYMNSCQLSDALGNTSHQYGCKLSPFEPAWKVSARAFRTREAQFSDDEKWTASGLEIPAADTGMLLSESKAFGSAQIAVAAVGGGGSIKYTSLGGTGGSSSYSGSVGQVTFNIDHDSSYSYTGTRTPATTTVDCPLPHLALRIDSLPENHIVELLVADDQQQPIKVHGPYQVADLSFWFLEPAEGVKTITPTVIVQEGRNFELLIKPPEIIRPSRRLPESEVLQRVAEVSQSPLLYSSMRTGNGELMLAVPGQTDLRNLTNNQNIDGGCAWSPDGAQIVFESYRDTSYKLYLMNADGTGVRPLTASAFSDHTPTWSPDGGKICFRRDTPDPMLGWELFLINADGTGEMNLTNHPANDADPAWSPLGDRIAFTSTREEGRWSLYTIQPDGAGIRLLSRTTNGYVYPAWSPDGSKIAFTGWVNPHYEIFVIDANGENETQLTHLEGLSSHCAWTPDGEHLAFLHRKDNFPYSQASLYVMRPDGSELRELVPIEMLFDSGSVAWQPQPKSVPDAPSVRDSNDDGSR
jgi:TolB protein